MLVIGGTHAGEIDGKDASLILTRSLLASSASDNPLKHLVMVLVPVFNVDGGHDAVLRRRPGPPGPGARMRGTSPRMQACDQAGLTPAGRTPVIK